MKFLWLAVEQSVDYKLLNEDRDIGGKRITRYRVLLMQNVNDGVQWCAFNEQCPNSPADTIKSEVESGFEIQNDHLVADILIKDIVGLCESLRHPLLLGNLSGMVHGSAA
jgi:hypothetical protein